MATTRDRWHTSLRVLIAAIVLSAASDASGEGSDGPAGTAATAALAGEYRHSAVSPAGNTRRSVATIAPRGAGFGVAWEEDGGNLFGGIGLSLDGVFGAAYTEALDGSFRGEGVLAYRIRGGTLDGVRLPYGSSGDSLIEETLEGSPALEGRFIIAHSRGGDGTSDRSGYVEIVRLGDTYQMTWFTPERSFEGVGLRIGDVLVAGYARGFAPGVIAYCADADLLTGIATYGHTGKIGEDRMKRANAGNAKANAEPSDHCRDAIAKWNPSLVRGGA